LKLMDHYYYEKKSFKGFNELVACDYGDLILKSSNKFIRGSSAEPYCAECQNPIFSIDSVYVFFCGHVFHVDTCIKQGPCPICKKSESTILGNIIASMAMKGANRPNGPMKNLGGQEPMMPQKKAPEPKLTPLLQKRRGEKETKINLLKHFEDISCSRHLGWLDFKN